MKLKHKLTPIKAIRKKCLDCSCGSVSEVKLCPVKECPIYPYRMGKRPKNIELPNEFSEKTGSLKTDSQTKLPEVIP